MRALLFALLFLAPRRAAASVSLQSACANAKTTTLTLAGSGSYGYLEDSSFPSLAAQFRSPEGVAVYGNTVFVSDTGSHTVRVVTSAGSSVLAGDPSAFPASGMADGFGTNAGFQSPSGLAYAPSLGTLYVADRGNHAIRAINVATGAVTTLAGTLGTAGYKDMWSHPVNVDTSAQFNAPRGVAFGQDGRLFVTDSGNTAIRVVATTPSDFAETGPIWCDSQNSFKCFVATVQVGSASSCYLSNAFLYGIAVDIMSPSQRLFVTDTVNNVIYAIFYTTDAQAANKYCTTLPVSGETNFMRLGGAQFDSFRGRLYVVDALAHRLYALNVTTSVEAPSAVSAAFAGNGMQGALDYSPAIGATFNAPLAIAFNFSSNLAMKINSVVVADLGNNKIRAVVDCFSVFTSTPSVSQTPSLSNSVSSTSTTSSSATVTSSATSSNTASATSSTTALASKTSSATSTASATSTSTNSPTSTSSKSSSASMSVSACASVTSSPSITSSTTSSISASSTSTSTSSVSSSPSSTSSSTRTSTSSATSTVSPTSTASLSSEPSKSSSSSTSHSTTPTSTSTGSASVTTTSSRTVTPTKTGTATSSSTATSLKTRTASSTGTASSTTSAAMTASATATATASSSTTSSSSATATASSTATTTASNVPYNHAPVLDLFNVTNPGSAYAPVFVERAGGAARATIFSPLQFTDFENSTLINATITIVSGCSAGDTLSAVAPRAPSSIVVLPYVGYAADGATPCVLRLYSTTPVTSTLAEWSALFQSIEFGNSLLNPSTANRTFSVVVWDVGGISGSTSVDVLQRPILGFPMFGTASFTLQWSPWNDAPSLEQSNGTAFVTGSGASAAPVNWYRASGPVVVAPGISAADPEETISFATVTVSTNCTNGDVLNVSSSILNATWDSSSCTLTVATFDLSPAPPSVFTPVLRAVTFDSTGAAPKSFLGRGITFFVMDIVTTTVGSQNGPMTASFTALVGMPDEAPVVLAAPSSLILSEDVNGVLSSAQNASFVAGDWDPADVSVPLSWDITGIEPLDGSSDFFPFSSAADLFAITQVSAVSQSCASAVGIGGACASFLPPASNYTIVVRPGVRLSALAPKLFVLAVQAAESSEIRGGGALTSPLFFVSVSVTRSNAPVSWPNGAATLAVNVTENSPAGSLITVFAAVDADSWQSLSYRINATNATLGARLFSLTPLASEPFVLPSGRGVSPSRAVNLTVGLDALDFELGNRVIWLRVVVTDDGSQPWPALSPREPTTSAIDVYVYVTNVRDDPVITAVSGEPLSGYSTSGGESVILNGAGLGLPGASVAGVQVAECASVSAGLKYSTTACTVITRLSAVSCTVPPGVGAGYAWRLLVGNVWSSWSNVTAAGTPAPTSFSQLGTSTPAGSAPGTTSYARAQIFSITPMTPGPAYLTGVAAGSGQCPAFGSTATRYGACTSSGSGDGTDSTYLISGAGLGGVASASSLSVRYGLTGVENVANCAVAKENSALLCAAAPGASTGLMWTLSVGGQSSLPPTTGYAPPSITGVTMSRALIPTDGNTTVVLTGLNFGPLGSASANANGLRWVMYGAFPLPTAPFPALNYTASSCAVTVAHTQITCSTVSGFGVNLRWWVAVGNQVSPPTSFVSAYAPPLITGVSLLGDAGSNRTLSNAFSVDGSTGVETASSVPILFLDTNCSNSALDVVGENFGPAGVARVSLSNIVANTTFYASSTHLLTLCSPGIGKDKFLTVEVGQSNRARYPAAYRAPTFGVAARLQGTGGDANPVVVQLNGTNFGACCVCDIINCGFDGGVGGTAGIWSFAGAVAAHQARCAVKSCGLSPSAVNFSLSITDAQGAVTHPIILAYNDTLIQFQTPLTSFNVTMTVGGQSTAPYVFDLKTAVSALPFLDSAVFKGPVGTTELLLMSPANLLSAAGDSLTVTGKYLDVMGAATITLENVGALHCPAVYSTIQVGSPVCGTKYMTASCPGGVCPPGASVWGALQTVSTLINSDGIELRSDSPLKTVDPLAVLDRNVNNTGSSAWRLDKPHLCHVTHWCSPTSGSNVWSVTIAMPPGQGGFRVHTFSAATGLNSTNSIEVAYGQTKNINLRAVSGCGGDSIPCSDTDGDLFVLTGDNLPPAENIYSLWGPYLLDAITPALDGGFALPSIYNNPDKRMLVASNAILFTPSQSTTPVMLRDSASTATIISWDSTMVMFRATEGVSAAMFLVGLYTWTVKDVYNPNPPCPTPTTCESHFAASIQFSDTNTLCYPVSSLLAGSFCAYGNAVKQLQFNRATLVQTVPMPLLRTSGNVRVTFVGSSFGASVCPGAACLASVAVQASPNGELGTVSSAPYVVSHNHSAIIVQVPAGMGQIFLRLALLLGSGILESRPGDSVYAQVKLGNLTGPTFSSNPLLFSYAFLAPVVTRVTTPAAQNPCIGLRADGLRDAVLVANSTYPGDGSNGLTCFRTYAKTAAGLSRFSTLTLFGYNFGQKSLQPSVTVDGVKCAIEEFCDPSAACAAPVATPDAAKGELSPEPFWEQAITCTLSAEVPGRNISEVIISAAFRVVSSSRNFPRTNLSASAALSVAVDGGFLSQVRAACDIDLYAPRSGDLCLPCPDGALCIGGLERPAALPGYWLVTVDVWKARALETGLIDELHPSFLPCPYAPACLGTVAGVQTCEKGYEGFLCSDCGFGYGGSAGGACGPCFDGSFNAFLVAVVVIAVAIGAVVFVRMSMERSSRVTLLVKMAINFLQLVGSLQTYEYFKKSGSPLKKIVESMYTVLSFANIDAPALSCSAGADYFGRFFSTMMVIPVLIALPAVLLTLHALVLYYLFGRSFSFSRIKRVTITASIVMIFFVHNSIVVTSLQYFDCQSVESGGFLKADPRVTCGSDEYKANKLWAGFFFALYGFLIPFIGACLLFLQRQKLQLNRTIKYYGFLYDGFDVSQTFESIEPPVGMWLPEVVPLLKTPWFSWRLPLRAIYGAIIYERWWYECFVMVRKLVFVAIGILVNSGATQLIIGLLLMVVFTVHQSLLRPFKNQGFNLLETASLLGNLFCFFSVLMTYFIESGAIPNQGGYAALSVGLFTYFIIAIVGVFFVVLLLETIIASHRLVAVSKERVKERRRILSLGKTSTHTLRTAESAADTGESRVVVSDGRVSLFTRTTAANRHAQDIAGTQGASSATPAATAKAIATKRMLERLDAMAAEAGSAGAAAAARAAALRLAAAEAAAGAGDDSASAAGDDAFDPTTPRSTRSRDDDDDDDFLAEDLDERDAALFSNALRLPSAIGRAVAGVFAGSVGASGSPRAQPPTSPLRSQPEAFVVRSPTSPQSLSSFLFPTTAAPPDSVVAHRMNPLLLARGGGMVGRTLGRGQGAAVARGGVGAQQSPTMREAAQVAAPPSSVASGSVRILDPSLLRSSK